MTTTPNPGSDLARSQGCLCPVMDNGHGRGAYVDAEHGPQFWITEGCPLHPAHPVRVGREERP